MPCDTIQTFTLKLENANQALVALALTQLRAENKAWNNAYVTNDGTVKIRSAYGNVNSTAMTQQLKRQYSMTVVQQGAIKQGWTMGQQQTNELGQLTISATKAGGATGMTATSSERSSM
jgi:hypothetical protein